MSTTLWIKFYFRNCLLQKVRKLGSTYLARDWDTDSVSIMATWQLGLKHNSQTRSSLYLHILIWLYLTIRKSSNPDILIDSYHFHIHFERKKTHEMYEDLKCKVVSQNTTQPRTVSEMTQTNQTSGKKIYLLKFSFSYLQHIGNYVGRRDQKQWWVTLKSWKIE